MPIESPKKTLKFMLDFVPIPFRLGPDFRRVYYFLQKSQWWNLEELREYQFHILRRLLEYAAQNVPFYQKQFKALGLEAQDIQTFDDFQKLPILDKETVKANVQELLATNYPSTQRVFLTTGGSTGAPMGFYRSQDAYRKTLAFEWRNYNWNNYRFGDKVAVLRSHVVEPGISKFDRAKKALVFSAHKMNDANLPQYLTELDKFAPKFILAYPSAIELLAGYVHRQHCEPQFLKTLKGIFTSSESLYPDQKKMVESVFKTKIFDKYGNSEMVTMIGMCGHGSYHDFMEYSYTEILDAAGNPVTAEGGVGEIVGTAFVNDAMPLIRYRTGDQVVVTHKKCPCGRAHPRVKSILGREREVIIARDLSRIPLAPVIFGIHDDRWHQIRRIQFVQEKPGELTILAETTNSDSEVAANYLKMLFEKRLESNFTFDVRIVEQIPLTERGKFKYLVQKIEV